MRATSGEFELTALTAYPPISTLEMKHVHVGNVNEYKVKWNDDNVISLKYDRIR